MTRASARLVGLVATLAVAGGCKETTAAKWSDSLGEAEARWQHAAIQDYDFTFSVSCFCAFTARCT